MLCFVHVHLFQKYAKEFLISGRRKMKSNMGSLKNKNKCLSAFTSNLPKEPPIYYYHEQVQVPNINLNFLSK